MADPSERKTAMRRLSAIGCGLIPVGLFCAGLYAITHQGAANSVNGNLRDRPLTTKQAARQKRADDETREYHKRIRYWIYNIERGEASFREAGCVLELHGEWEDEEERCEVTPSLP